jgi:hypothetical protein
MKTNNLFDNKKLGSGIVINWPPRFGSENQNCGVTDPDTKEIFLEPQLCLFHKNLILL